MIESGKSAVTMILNRVRSENDSAVRELMPLVYNELREIAASFLKRERPDHTLQATALVHEAFVKMVNQRDIAWQNRAHFFAVAAQAIRRILVDHARTHGRKKRGGDCRRMHLDDDLAWTGRHDLDLLALDEALAKLAELDPRQARIVELRFFGGLTLKDAAAVLDVSPRTVDGDWSMARAWLRRELSEACR